MSAENQQFIVSDKGFNGGSTLGRTRRYLRKGQDLRIDQQRLDTEGFVATQTVRKNTKGILTYIAMRPSASPSSPKVRVAAFEPNSTAEYIDYLGFEPQTTEQSLVTYAVALLSARMQEVPVQVDQRDSLPTKENRYPQYTAMYDITVPKNGNIIIADIPCSPALQGAIEDLSASSGRQVLSYDGEQLTQGLLDILPSFQKILDDNIAILFPGSGGGTVLDYLTKLAPDQIARLSTTDRLFQFPFGRTYVGNNYFEAQGELPDQFRPEMYRGIIIIDDVVASRKTVIELIRQIKARCADEDSTPTINMYAWLALDPAQAARTNNRVALSSTSAPGARSLQTVINYEGEAGIPPCNSLSTLLRGDEKTKAVLQSLSKYFSRESLEQFLTTISL